MKKFTVIVLFFGFAGFVGINEVAAQANFHAGVHSGSYTIKRAQQLERESKDPRRSCPNPYCARCSKHLADYGHEYQLIGGPSQGQPFYRGTQRGIAAATAGCGYDEHSQWYTHRGRPVATMSWEYQRYLNHAVTEQIAARNAVAALENCEDAIEDLTALREHIAAQGDQEALAGVDAQLAVARRDLRRLTAIADEAVRIALLSKSDADKATRFQRIFHKPEKVGGSREQGAGR